MSEAYWEPLYQAGDMRWEKGAPSPGLVDFHETHHSLPGETVCVPGGGTGHDALVWAKAGFRTYGYDIAPSAIRLSIERARGAGARVEFRQADFLRDEPPFPFDWLWEHTLFCAIQPDERELYVRAVLRWLKPGGNFLAVNYFIPDKDGPPFGTNRDEIWKLFSPVFDLKEEWVPRSYPNRSGLERMFWWTSKTS